MDAARFDSLTRFFSDRRLSRRDAVVKGGGAAAATGLALSGFSHLGAAQEASPEATDATTPELLFVQTFQAGSIAAKEGAEGRYTLSLEAGVGQTIFFSNQPDRIVGTETTGTFLDNLGFPDDNPPNAALLVTNAAGETDVAVIELFSPVYDQSTEGVTYEIEVLANWTDETGISLQEDATNLSELEPSFGAAHLFIDGILDCPDHDLICYNDANSWQNGGLGSIPNADHDGFCVSGPTFFCYPCSAPAAGGTWADECNRRFADCNDGCDYWPTCTSNLPSWTGCAGRG